MIHGGKKSGGRPCFILEIDTSTGNASLLDLEAGRWGDTCFTDGSPALIKVAVWIAVSRGARQIELTDNSVIICKRTKEKIDLAELSFITTGKTWYERLIPGLTPVDTIAVERLEVWRQAVFKKTWAEVVPFLPGIEVGYQDVLAKDVLAKMKKSGEWCEFFANNMDNLRKAFGIERRIHGSHWIAPLASPEQIQGSRKTRKSRKGQT